MTDQVHDITEVPETPKPKRDWKKIGKLAGTASALLLVGFGAGRLSNGTEDSVDVNPVDHDPTPGE